MGNLALPARLTRYAPAVTARAALEAVVVPRLERGEVRLFLSDTAPELPAASGAAAAARTDRLPARFFSARHAHGAHELGWVTHGRCVLAVEARELLLSAGDACLVRPG